jgi:hypothetical protein
LHINLFFALIGFINKEKKRHRARKAIFTEIEKHLSIGLQLLEDAKSDLGPEDPTYKEMAYLMGNYSKAAKSIAALIKKGTGIEDFRPDKRSKSSDEYNG